MNKKNTIKTIQTVIVARDNNHLSELISESMREHGNECDLNHIDTSHVTDMQFLFHESKFNGDISNWNVSNVEHASLMFYNFPSNGNLFHWDVSNITNMDIMQNFLKKTMYFGSSFVLKKQIDV
jgi:short-subunit dehydrogenase